MGSTPAVSALVDLETIGSVFQAANTIAVIGHIRPDADAIGSIAAVVSGARFLGKEANGYIGQRTAIAENLLTIPGAAEIEIVEQFPKEPDLIVVVDCGDAGRVGRLGPELEKYRHKVAVLDHHSSNSGFGAWNYIDVAAESTTVIVSQLLKYLKVPLTTAIAHQLYAGLVTDTGSFRWGSSYMHEMAISLMQYGIDIRQIASDLISGVSASDLNIIGEILQKAEILPIVDYPIVFLTIKNSLYTQLSDSAIETIVDFGSSVQGTEIGVVLKEVKPARWSVSLRSSSCDIAQLAEIMGGGGHRAAAAFIATGTAQEVRTRLQMGLENWLTGDLQ
ncbi:DHH family phosphoesterase [Corynebacterium caspium]|uniref:DHH family phosphoesterase n=1 Tax=Corynebacterium caspium TaxID=234828 RepID=UPI00037A6E09|nr:DHH family phosphoesterase [Corynebacterium caspium]WKD59091.1 Bifunctional oligoribonuclease and PAP phosphatase NrnA [Corynebacterium caspium DSM 44850]